MRLLIDMNLSPLWVQFFAEYRVESVHWSSVGDAGASDSEILDYAESHGFIVFTHDLDFGTLLAAHKFRGPSVIQIRTQEVLPSKIGPVVMRAIRASSTLLEEGAIVTIEPARNRIRILPL